MDDISYIEGRDGSHAEKKAKYIKCKHCMKRTKDVIRKKIKRKLWSNEEDDQNRTRRVGFATDVCRYDSMVILRATNDFPQKKNENEKGKNRKDQTNGSSISYSFNVTDSSGDGRRWEALPGALFKSGILRPTVSSTLPVMVSGVEDESV